MAFEMTCGLAGFALASLFYAGAAQYFDLNLSESITGIITAAAAVIAVVIAFRTATVAYKDFEARREPFLTFEIAEIDGADGYDIYNDEKSPSFYIQNSSQFGCWVTHINRRWFLVNKRSPSLDPDDVIGGKTTDTSPYAKKIFMPIGAGAKSARIGSLMVKARKDKVFAQNLCEKGGLRLFFQIIVEVEDLGRKRAWKQSVIFLVRDGVFTSSLPDDLEQFSFRKQIR